MCSTVILCGSEKARVINLILTLHESRYELIRRKTPKRAVFGWNDDVKSAYRGGNFSLLREPIESEFRGSGGDAECRLSVAGDEMITSAGGEARDVFLSAQMADSSFHLLKVSLSNTFSKQIEKRALTAVPPPGDAGQCLDIAKPLDSSKAQ